MTSQQQQDDFYVGYLPTPSSHRRLLKRALPMIIAVAAAAIGLLAFSQRNPGESEWRSSIESFSGTLRATPWPMLISDVQDAPTAILLVEEGKHGSHARVRPLADWQATVRGYVITRDGRTILELTPGKDAIVASAPNPQADALEQTSQGKVELIGEIIDSKCYHGAMKPGEGKTHKACATVCIGNGIPAMFLASDASTYLIAPTDGFTLDDDSLSKIGEPVRIRGTVSRVADLRVLHITPRSVERVQR